jgi:beta-glucosidase
MSFTEKANLLYGIGDVFDPKILAVGQVAGVPRLHIPDVVLNDGPQGFRTDRAVLEGTTRGTSTQYPSGLTIAATWDPDAAREWGVAMGQEFRAKGAHVQLGPAMDIARNPGAGRNWESLSGEDPHLGVVLAPAAIKGIQGQGIAAVAKHFVCYNQERHRYGLNVQVDPRVLREIYLPPFEASVKDGGVASIMCSYNNLWGKMACEQNETLKGILRDDWKFQGWVMSDWDMNGPGARGLIAGQDMVMSGRYTRAGDFNNSVLAPHVDAAAFRVLDSLQRIGALRETKPDDLKLNVSTPECMAIARSLSERSMVLLKNEDRILPLPLSAGRVRRIVLTG